MLCYDCFEQIVFKRYVHNGKARCRSARDLYNAEDLRYRSRAMGQRLVCKFTHIYEETDWVPRWKTVIAGSILLKAFGVHFYVLSSFESRNEEMRNKNCNYRLMKGEHLLSKHQDLPHLASEPFLIVPFDRLFQLFVKGFERLTSPV